jgi:hypothetical protein
VSLVAGVVAAAVVAAGLPPLAATILQRDDELVLGNALMAHGTDVRS